jgi:hypothetical protein
VTGLLLLAAALTLAPADVLANYRTAVAQLRVPRILTFEYTIEQTGLRNGEQVHRIFRSLGDERDELLAVDGKRLVPPKVAIFHHRRYRYALADLAPRMGAYDFRFIGTRRNARHIDDYVFATTARKSVPFRITSVTIDGASFVPVVLAFATSANAGSGTLSFARRDRYWVATEAIARATLGNIGATERIAFARYRFPLTLPPSTFSAQKGRGADPLDPRLLY